MQKHSEAKLSENKTIFKSEFDGNWNFTEKWQENIIEQWSLTEKIIKYRYLSGKINWNLIESNNWKPKFDYKSMQEIDMTKKKNYLVYEITEKIDNSKLKNLKSNYKMFKNHTKKN